MSKYTISYGDKSFEASVYQEKIFDFIKEGVGNLVINASAGSSKTTTILNCLKLIDNKKVVFLAFNKSIVDEIKSKIERNKSTNITTFHGLGFSILSENLKLRDECVDEFKYSNYIKNNINELSETYKNLPYANQILFIKNINKLIEYFRYFLVNKESRMRKIAEKYNILCIGDEISVCMKLMEWGSTHTETIDYTDMVWLPNVLNLTTKYFKYDWVFIDEGQDTSIMEQELIKKCYVRGTRFVVVGDIDQQINVWAGADSGAFNRFIKEKNTEEMELPISYRCPKKIIQLAQQFSDRIQPNDDAIEGEIRNHVSKNEPVNSDMVLCRTTAPLVDLQLYYLRRNKKSYIKGSENIKDEYLSLINCTNAKEIDYELKSENGLFFQLYTNLFKLKDRLKNTFKLDDEDAISHPEFLSMYDNIEAIKVISEGMETVDDVNKKIIEVFGTKEEGVILSTVHKAKGLEADNVYILYHSLMPSRMAKMEWEITSERNLQYVAYTRAKKTLNFMEESGRWSINNGYMNAGSMLIYLSGIANKIGYKFDEGTEKLIEQTKKERTTEKRKNKVIENNNFNVRSLL